MTLVFLLFRYLLISSTPGGSLLAKIFTLDALFLTCAKSQYKKSELETYCRGCLGGAKPSAKTAAHGAYRSGAYKKGVLHAGTEVKKVKQTVR